VRAYRTAQGWKAPTLFRDYDGVTRAVKRHGRTRRAAERSLAAALRDRVRVGGTESITRDSRVAALCQAFLTQVAEQGKAPTTTSAYEYAAERHIIPGLGGLRVHEHTVGTVTSLSAFDCHTSWPRYGQDVPVGAQRDVRVGRPT
jgi:hypothetical protein